MTSFSVIIYISIRKCRAKMVLNLIMTQLLELQIRSSSMATRNLNRCIKAGDPPLKTRDICAMGYAECSKIGKYDSDGKLIILAKQVFTVFDICKIKPISVSCLLKCVPLMIQLDVVLHNSENNCFLFRNKF